MAINNIAKDNRPIESKQYTLEIKKRCFVEFGVDINPVIKKPLYEVFEYISKNSK